MAKIDGKSLAAIGIGSVFVWSGIKGWSILATIGDLVTGKPPHQSVINPLTSGEVPGSAVGNVAGGSSSSILQTAMQYQGHPYKFGGAPGANAENPWDCSSFVNFVIGVRLNGAIPGYKPGAYRGQTHGPPTGSWAVWPGLQRVGRSEVSAGDIIVWGGHMGIAIDSSTMISALNPSAGTKVGAIDGAARGPIITTGRYIWQTAGV